MRRWGATARSTVRFFCFRWSARASPNHGPATSSSWTVSVAASASTDAKRLGLCEPSSGSGRPILPVRTRVSAIVGDRRSARGSSSRSRSSKRVREQPLSERWTGCRTPSQAPSTRSSPKNAQRTSQRRARSPRDRKRLDQRPSDAWFAAMASSSQAGGDPKRPSPAGRPAHGGRSILARPHPVPAGRRPVQLPGRSSPVRNDTTRSRVASSSKAPSPWPPPRTRS